MTRQFRKLTRLLCLPSACFALSISPTQAQEPTTTESKPAPVAVSTADVTLATDRLSLVLEPLTKDELAIEAGAWRDIVKAKVQAISDAELASPKKTGTDATAARTSLMKLREEKAVLMNRFGTVLSAYELKGGDAAELRAYAKAVSFIRVDINDAGAAWDAVTGWLISKEGGIKVLFMLIRFLAVMFVFWILARIVRRMVKKAAAVNKTFSDLLEQFLIKMSFRAVLAIGLLVALSSVGFNVGALLAVIGGASFIIGFALQDTLGNFASGIMLLIYRPFDVGDVVEVGGVSGKIDQVSLVSTTIRTFDNKVVLVPNKKVWGEVITNASASARRRVDMVFGIGYDDDEVKAKSILEKIVEANDKVLANPEPVVQMHELADSSVNFICRPWVATADYWDVHWEVTSKVKEEFDAAGISIPYPQQDLHIHQVGGA
jgi:small conductance mechanosensitive channel